MLLFKQIHKYERIMDWNHTLQNIDLGQLSPHQVGILTAFFTEDLESRLTRLVQLDDQIHTDRDGYIRRFVNGWSQICESTSVEVRGLDLGERVSRLEGSVLGSPLYPHYSPFDSGYRPQDMTLYERITYLEGILLPTTHAQRVVEQPSVMTPTSPLQPSPHENMTSPEIRRFRENELNSDFYRKYGFLHRGTAFMSDSEKWALNKFLISISASMESMSVIAKKYLGVKASIRRPDEGILKTFTGSQFTEAQNDELQFLKLVFYELAKVACRKIQIASVHSSEDYRTNVSRLYYLIQNSKIVDDHRSSLISPTRLFKTALRRALSKRIKFTTVRSLPVSVQLLALKMDMKKLTLLPNSQKTLRIQERVGGYCEISGTRFGSFCEKYQEHIPDYFQFELDHTH